MIQVIERLIRPAELGAGLSHSEVNRCVQAIDSRGESVERRLPEATLAGRPVSRAPFLQELGRFRIGSQSAQGVQRRQRLLESPLGHVDAGQVV